jgi:hypothetical protein
VKQGLKQGLQLGLQLHDALEYIPDALKYIYEVMK